MFFAILPDTRLPGAKDEREGLIIIGKIIDIYLLRSKRLDLNIEVPNKTL